MAAAAAVLAIDVPAWEEVEAGRGQDLSLSPLIRKWSVSCLSSLYKHPHTHPRASNFLSAPTSHPPRSPALGGFGGGGWSLGGNQFFSFK